MARKSSKDLSVQIKELCDSMIAKWEPETFFAELLRMYGIANDSIKMALQDAPGFNVASKEVDETMARPDIAISRSAYFRFVKDDADAAAAMQSVRALKEVTGTKHKFQYLICAAPNTIHMFDTIEHDNLVIGYEDLPGYYSFMLPLLEGRRARIVSSQEADRKACLKLTRLLDTLADHNNISSDSMEQLNSFMVRILFCFFAEDTGVFPQGDDNVFSNAFNKLVDMHGTNARKFFEDLFTVLNTPETDRKNLENKVANELLQFPYVNGGLFAQTGFIPEFDIATRNQFTDCGNLRWSDISPAVFGSMFQGAMNKAERRNMGAHYTSEENILKLIKPLFLDALYEEFHEIRRKAEASDLKMNTVKKKCYEFLERMSKLKFLDPACGCGNFLLVTYKELRTLENQVLEYIKAGSLTESFIDINQFYGIEIEDWPVEIAHVSMWLMQHLMNQQANATLGSNMSSIPLKSSATIVRANALTTDWNDIIPASECSYILGNPPFLGGKNLSAEQKQWLKSVYPPEHTLGNADLVTAWFVKASDYMMQNKNIRAALVSTNSICQGEQVNTLWGLLLDKGIHINFAYKPFLWTNDAAEKAAVTCIIVGFSYEKLSSPALFFTQTKDGSVLRQECNQISPYLKDCKEPVIVQRRSTALSASLNLTRGNQSTDGGNLIFSFHEGQELLSKHPEVKPFLKKYVGSAELMTNEFRYCLWFENEADYLALDLAIVNERIDKVKTFRLSSTRSVTIKAAARPWSFTERSTPPFSDKMLVIPVISSENRNYRPMDFFSSDYIVSNLAFFIPDASNYDFGVLSSRMHMVWNKFTAGSLKSDLRYSKDLTYNTFIWPDANEEQRADIDQMAKKVRLTKVNYKYRMNLGDMYNIKTMPEELREAHEALDAAVERAYRDEPFRDDDERLVFLINLYSNAIAAEQKAAKNTPSRRKKAAKS
ncbi:MULTISPECIES: DNA methyltransferase [unclassified Anaerobiospirillum]|uniref:class I SAM-dependent DNA methyltransferase n=1 Tax=unclassified Anaerobiospirillum TaxID=2647410 RepID=UPI001FF2E1F4|nr:MULTISPECIES: DNA methyltransferase [unclassified Anaerobiospirillum]MCK0534843.1 N-6 DNA methylase [Anaerobiospirillum sp. NML120511]MCK0540137.1 N-6 DNA methylase [Anaerobiospirillum sp. NML02-A-032]